MIASQLTKAALDLMGNSVGAALAKDGRLSLYSGRRGGESTLLSEMAFPKEFKREGSVIKFAAFETVKAIATGDATWFSAETSDGRLLEGSVGKQGADLTVEDPRIYAGMELTLEGFDYNLRLGSAA